MSTSFSFFNTCKNRRAFLILPQTQIAEPLLTGSSLFWSHFIHRDAALCDFLKWLKISFWKLQKKSKKGWTSSNLQRSFLLLVRKGFIMHFRKWHWWVWHQLGLRGQLDEKLAAFENPDEPYCHQSTVIFYLIGLQTHAKQVVNMM